MNSNVPNHRSFGIRHAEKKRGFPGKKGKTEIEIRANFEVDGTDFPVRKWAQTSVPLEHAVAVLHIHRHIGRFPRDTLSDPNIRRCAPLIGT
ncbi:hypothetical protein JTE90_003477 [Oedothorax gibbosus]|uniref:Uncharacterized protein n=1 Tax=Oedothorax gibbosus TaxID=931172 RepID=A0AAV6UGI4_9ARAC|nr:hypothetical protein JTE90_003477 [Oedothorax gibbosus]